MAERRTQNLRLRPRILLPSFLEGAGPDFGEFPSGLTSASSTYDASRTSRRVPSLASGGSFDAPKYSSGSTHAFLGRVHLDNARADKKSNIPAARRLRQVRIRPIANATAELQAPKRVTQKRRPAKAVRSPTRRVIFLHVTPTTWGDRENFSELAVWVPPGRTYRNRGRRLERLFQNGGWIGCRGTLWVHGFAWAHESVWRSRARPR
jgi:hypothetical protein